MAKTNNQTDALMTMLSSGGTTRQTTSEPANYIKTITESNNIITSTSNKGVQVSWSRGGTGTSTWGNIAGNIDDQKDLVDKFAEYAKLSSENTFTSYNYFTRNTNVGGLYVNSVKGANDCLYFYNDDNSKTVIEIQYSGHKETNGHLLLCEDQIHLFGNDTFVNIQPGIIKIGDKKVLTEETGLIKPDQASCIIAMNGSKEQTTLEYGVFNVANRIAQWDSNKCLYTDTPTNNDHCANKSYVDTSITTLETSLKAYIDSLNGNDKEF